MMPRRRADDESIGRWVLIFVAAAAIVVGGYYWYRNQPVEPGQPTLTQAPPPPPPVAGAPAVVNPMPPPPEISPLPTLNESDATVSGELAALFGQDTFATLFNDNDIIRRITVTVDNMPREKLALRLRPLKPMDSAFLASGEAGQLTLGPANYQRYEPYVQVLEKLDADSATALYVRLYPLFQKAYEELGNLDGYFNDRVIAAIDDLLAAPEITDPIALTQPNVMYEFADPDLQARSAGQKLLLRMGPENAARVKAKLKEFRERIATQRPPD
jgi:hypothetical protein